MDKKTVRLICNRMEWSLNETEIIPKSESDARGYYEVTGVDKTIGEPFEADVYMDNPIDDKFDYEKYLTLCSNEKNRRLIIVFASYDREKTVYNNTFKYYRGPLKKRFKSFWELKSSIYTDSLNSIKLSVDKEGINYLEYANENKIEGFCFNISIAELLKVLNVTGTNLFIDNVRIGLNGTEMSKKLKENFRDYLISSILSDEDFCSKNNLKVGLEDILNEKRAPFLFWYSHNGITIYSKKDNSEKDNSEKDNSEKDNSEKDNSEKDNSENDYSIPRNGSIIELDPLRISVINGAQTISDFHLIAEEVKNSIRKLNRDLGDDQIETCIRRALEALKVKTTIINGPADYVSLVALGLNTQIPVGPNEGVVHSKMVKSINLTIEPENLKIIRAGEREDDYHMLPVSFIKMFYVTQDKPGKARNLDTKKLSQYFEEAYKKISEDDNIVHSLKAAIEANKWWRNNQNYRINVSEDIKSAIENARLYFCSYWLKYKSCTDIKEGYTSPKYEVAFDSMRDRIRAINDKRKESEKITSNDFKKDDLYQSIIKSLQHEST